jgi:hypothetical protein
VSFCGGDVFIKVRERKCLIWVKGWWCRGEDRVITGKKYLAINSRVLSSI